MPLFGSKFDLRRWAEEHNIYGPVRSDMVYFVRDGDTNLLNIFTDLCHHEVTDRPPTFNFEKRKQLYKRWLSAGQPCLMLVHRGSQALVASIILALTEAAYRSVWWNGLDALDIDSSHLVRFRSRAKPRYFLVDILVRNRSYINSLPASDRAQLKGIGIRATVRHLAEFAGIDTAMFKPLILCSSLDPGLQTVLSQFGFEKRSSHVEGGIMYRADFVPKDLFSRSALELIDRLRQTMQEYSRERLSTRARHPSE